MINLSGYQILAKIYESDKTVVYRGCQQKSNLPVILKVLKEDYPTVEERNRYQQEFELLNRLNLDSVVKAYALETYKNSLVMVLEDFGGESLKQLLASQKFTLLGFLNLAIRIVKSLGDLHQANIIHKDINPANIAFNPATGQVKLVDLSISTIFNREAPLSSHAPTIEGTLAYMSPEQTGRLNRSLDYRTDFYSLGTTFYELLTHKLPFEANETMELIHCHIAKQPIAPHVVNPEIPPVVSDLVMKLLAKNAEDRYQSSWGLLADLERCLVNRKENDSIDFFPLGEQDISDKFKIPEKLYGRDKEIDTLLAAFERVANGQKEFMLVSGYSGIGKSALVQEIYKPITRRNGYFILGKFDQFQRSIPYFAIVKAFSELVNLLLTESEQKLKVWKEKLLEAFGPNGQIIIDVIPEIEYIIGPQPPVLELGPTESQNRFNLVFQNFVRIFCAPEHPLVMFLDDLQWADSATLKLIELMLTEGEVQNFFLIGAYRDNEVSPSHPLIMMLDSLRIQSVTINQIHLENLNLNQIRQLISETLHQAQGLVRPLAELVKNKTAGNPFFVNEFLKTLYQEKLLTFVPPQPDIMGGWSWNLAEIESMSITENVVDLMIGKLRKLPEKTQDVLRLSACLGNQFDLNTLSLIYEKESYGTFQDLLPAIEEKMIQPNSGRELVDLDLVTAPLLILNYKFSHDRVQQAAYALIDDTDKKAVHLKIGRMLLERTPVEYRSERIFELVDHMNVGRSLITEHEEILELAQLNLEAGKRAKDATAFVAASQYLKEAMSRLPDNIWQLDHNFAFALYKERADVEYLNGNFAESEALTSEVLSQVDSDFEKAEIYNILLIQNTLRGQYQKAVEVGRIALGLLGIELPTEHLDRVIPQELEKAGQALGNRPILELLDQPLMEDSVSQMKVKLLNNLAPPTYMLNIQLWTLMILTGARLVLEEGYTPEVGFFLPTYGILLVNLFGEYRNAYDLGRVAYQLNQKWGHPTYKAGVCLVSTLNYWFNPMKESTALGNEAYQSALDSGDLMYAGYVLHNQSINFFVQGKPVNEILEEIPKYLPFAQKTENQLVTEILLGLQLVLHNLDAQTDEPLNFDGPSLTEAEYVALCQQNQNLFALCIYQIFKMQTLYIYGNLEAALALSKQISEQLQLILGTVPVTEYNFYSSLVYLSACDGVEEDEKEVLLSKVRKNQNQLKIWSENCAANFLPKYLLVEAELARVKNDFQLAIDLYDRAIAVATEHELIAVQALGNERAADFWLQNNKFSYALVHLREAYYNYQKWGVKRKVESLQLEYPQLAAKLSQPTEALDVNKTIHTSTNSISSSLDLNTVLKASQAISSEIVLDKLLGNLMKILIENAGAQSGFLLLPKEGKLLISASASVDEEAMINSESKVLETSEELPVSVINYVERSLSDVVLSHACQEGQFTNDPYIIKHKVKSILCIPIVSQGQLISILYLENNLTTDAFTGDRIEVLQVLSSQAAIALDNALLYASVEQKVQERTQELNEKNQDLSQTLEELQRTQAQLIQTEKMSGLGQMVAGVAHEINNPVSFIYGNLAPATEYVQDLLALIDLYQTHYPNPVEEIEELIEDIDLEFISEDLKNLLNSMQVGAERIRNIILSLRNFSRLDEADKKPVNLHDGLDSTLLILQNRFKESGNEKEIKIIKEYGNLPLVNCYASQLNQVFMNLLTNACDAMQDQRSVEASDRHPSITVSTQVSDRQSVEISIADNGPGMTEETIQKIFNPFYTTKPVGSGTGLGLSISYQIVVEKHSGQLRCVSQPGEGAKFIVEIPLRPVEEE
ncbi:AAA family ATPase [Roseofilum sp. BLCC_M154]|uniref:histidine kinase n=1 Tax=Roseofilum acuticapitatum BLCC-M154 TaxID=3022444 RepID=A0ABT7AUK4_9CYAN|nr:ATP-binding sensor histidine kinase [Roseofilum acuticapitatum]MDJ1170579.1 AAA family ATPase [Roseofilum acuticapitatum BLCC-M154]